SLLQALHRNKVEVDISATGERYVKTRGLKIDHKVGNINDLVNALYKKVVTGNNTADVSVTPVKQYKELYEKIKHLDSTNVEAKGQFASTLHKVRSFFGNLFSNRDKKLQEINEKLNQMETINNLQNLLSKSKKLQDSNEGLDKIKEKSTE